MAKQLIVMELRMFAIGFDFAFLFLWLNIRTALRDVLLSGRGSSPKQFGGPLNRRRIDRRSSPRQRRLSARAWT